MSAVLDLASRLVRIPSVSGNEDGMRAVQREVVSFVADRIEDLDVREGGGPHPWTLLSTRHDRPATLYACHTDTVPTGDSSEWGHDPFAGTVDEGHLHGRGAVDMKGGLAAAAVALCEADDGEAPLALLMTADEEIGSLGAAEAAAVISDLPLRGIVIPEATGMRVRCGHRGAAWIRVTAHGVAAHGSAPQHGVNAVLRLAGALPTALATAPLRSDAFLGTETISVGRMEGGSAINIVPAAASAEIDQRTIGDAAELLQHWEGVEGIDEVAPILDLPPLSTDAEHPFVTGLPSGIDPSPVPYFTDGSVLHRTRPDVPVVIWGPGDPRQMHALDERIGIVELEDAVRLFRTERRSGH